MVYGTAKVGSARAAVSTTALLIVGSGIALMGCGGDKRSELKFDTANVQRGRLVARITATGTLSALVTVQVGSQVSGRIQDIYVDFNSPVTKEQIIAKIDPQLFQAALEQARANHVAAQANLAKAKAQALDARRQADRSKALMERNLIARAELDTAQSQADAAQAQVDAAASAVEQSRAALHQAEINLAYTSIHSPINGVVISRSVDVGQTVAASLQAPTLFTIAEDLRKMQVNTSVAEADVGKLAPGMSATFRVDAYPTESFRGSIRQIRNAPQTVQNVVTYDAVIDVDNAALKLKPGMTANVTVIYAERDDVLQVPNAALRFRPSQELLAKVGGGARGGGRGQGERGGGGRDGGRAGGWGGSNGQGGAGMRGPRGGGGGGADAPADARTVWVLRNGNPESVTVRVGVSDGSMTEVVEGALNEGDQVITDVLGGDQQQRPGGGGGGGGGMRRLF